jgi:metal-sulfur cluster biosynthetic enzyme
MSAHITPDQDFEDRRKNAICAELGKVLDPCSCASDHPINIVDFGLVDDIEIDRHGHVEVTLLLTSQRCTYFIDMSDEIVERVSQLPDVERVEVHQSTEGKIWTPDRMSSDERTARRERFHQRMEKAGITPYAEQR